MELRIGFSKSTKFCPIYSKAIIWWDEFRYGISVGSHTYGRFVSSSWGRDFIYQASGRATNFSGGEAWAKHNKVIEEYILDISDDAITQIGQTCVDREGKPYAILQTIGIALSGLCYILSGRSWQPDNIFADGDKEVNCLEEWARILSKDLDVDLPEKIDGLSIKPFRDWIAGLPMAKLANTL